MSKQTFKRPSKSKKEIRLEKAGKVAKSLTKVAAAAAPLVANLLPGPAGTIAKTLLSSLNDDAWWQKHPGESATTNTPIALVEHSGTILAGGSTLNYTTSYARAQVAFMHSTVATLSNANQYLISACFMPTINQVNQFIIPHIRAVVNAVPLVSAARYRDVLANNATLYAVWQTLKKFEYLTRHTPAYMTTYDDVIFPILQSSNAEVLQAQIKRVADALQANVRLPHTLCEYLGWRFGRVYKSANSAKAGQIMYNAFPVEWTIDDVKDYITQLITYTSLNNELVQANADLYTVYASHDQAVHIKDDSQYVYDLKEWMLRMNLSFVQRLTPVDNEVDSRYIARPVVIDSALSNPEVFMASTVSTAIPARLPSNASEDVTTYDVLFPVMECNVYMPAPKTFDGAFTGALELYDSFSISNTTPTTTSRIGYVGETVTASGGFRSKFVLLTVFQPKVPIAPNGTRELGSGTVGYSVPELLNALIACKSLDLYNMGVYVNAHYPTDSHTSDMNTGWTNLDLTAISIDTAFVPPDTIVVEHNYAMANLCSVSRPRSASRDKEEREIRSEVKDFVNEVTPSDTVIID